MAPYRTPRRAGAVAGHRGEVAGRSNLWSARAGDASVTARLPRRHDPPHSLRWSRPSRSNCPFLQTRRQPMSLPPRPALSLSRGHRRHLSRRRQARSPPDSCLTRPTHTPSPWLPQAQAQEPAAFRNKQQQAPRQQAPQQQAPQQQAQQHRRCSSRGRSSRFPLLSSTTKQYY